MSALQFLNKKSWHTGLIKNNEKVWLREQAAAKEQQRVAELQKQLEEERRLEEIQRLEIESGRLDPAEVKRRQRIEWMYEDVATAHSKAAKEQQAKEQEETLLGKKAAQLPIGRREKDPEKVRLIDTENKLREDPMLVMEKERRKALEDACSKSVVPQSREDRAKLAAKLARKAERREIREGRKRRRAEREATKITTPEANRVVETRVNSVRTVNDNARHVSEHHRFGLIVPKTGSGVAVKEKFVPRNSSSLDGRKRSRTWADVHADSATLRLDSPEERSRRRQKMQNSAEQLHQQRLTTIKEREAIREEEEREQYDERILGSQSVAGSTFAYNALRSSSNIRISERIMQRRAGASGDHTAY